MFYPVQKLKRTMVISLMVLQLCLTTWLPMGWANPAEVPQITAVTLLSKQQVYVQEIHTQPIVTIDTWINTGTAQETPQNNGVSHFLEHLLFKGTQKHPIGKIDRILESRGAEFNAATSDDFTHYHITTSSPHFKEAVELHADMLLNATINPPELERERQVVQEEINRSLDEPGRKAYIALLKMLFEKHPYAMDTLGPKSNIQNIPREAILRYYHAWYQPQNFRTVVVGDVNTQEAVAVVKEAFQKAYAAQSRPKALQPQMKPVLPLTRPQTKVITDPNLSESRMAIAFLAPPVTNREENYALDVAALVLGQGRSSRLYKHLKEDKQLVNDVSAANGTHQQAGVFTINVDAKPENRETIEQIIAEEVHRFKQEGPTPEELAKAKTQVIKSFAFSTESTAGVAGAIGVNVTMATLEDYTQYVSNIQKVTAPQVLAAVRKYLDFGKAAMVTLLPESNKAKAAIPQEESRQLAWLKTTAEADAKLAQKGIGSEEIQSKQQTAVSKVVLPNGATLLLKPTNTTKTVAVSMFAKGGRLAEPKPGVAGLTARVLMKGTQNRSAKELSQELESLGLSVSASSDEDYMLLSGTSVSDDLSKLLMILQDVLVNPAFPQEELDKERADLLEQIKTSRDQPSNLMFEYLTETLYRDHPYGAVGKRLEASLPNIQQADLKAFYRQQFQPQRMVISVVGNFNPTQLKNSLQQILSDLPASPGQDLAQATYPEVKPLPGKMEIVAQKPEQAATWVAYGWLAPGISPSRDYATLKLINTLLGGGLSSRLFVDLREKQGLAYHVSSLYPSMLKKSNFVMYIGTDPKNLEKVKDGFNTEIQQLQTEPVSPEELAMVKSKLIGSFALSHESNASQAFYLGLYETLGVGYQFDTQYPRLVEQVTAEDVQRVAKEIFSQPKVVTVVAPKVVRTDASSPAPGGNPGLHAH